MHKFRKSRFDFLIEETLYRNQLSGFLLGDYVKIKKNALKDEIVVDFSDQMKAQIAQIIKDDITLKISFIKSGASEAYSGPVGAANVAKKTMWADCYIEHAPGMWSNVMTLPLRILNRIEVEGANGYPQYNKKLVRDNPKMSKGDNLDNKLPTKNTKLKECFKKSYITPLTRILIEEDESRKGYSMNSKMRKGIENVKKKMEKGETVREDDPESVFNALRTEFNKIRSMEGTVKAGVYASLRRAGFNFGNKPVNDASMKILDRATEIADDFESGKAFGGDGMLIGPDTAEWDRSVKDDIRYKEDDMVMYVGPGLMDKSDGDIRHLIGILTPGRAFIVTNVGHGTRKDLWGKDILDKHGNKQVVRNYVINDVDWNGFIGEYGIEINNPAYLAPYKTRELIEAERDNKPTDDIKKIKTYDDYMEWVEDRKRNSVHKADADRAGKVVEFTLAKEEVRDFLDKKYYQVPRNIAAYRWDKDSKRKIEEIDERIKNGDKTIPMYQKILYDVYKKQIRNPFR